MWQKDWRHTGRIGLGLLTGVFALVPLILADEPRVPFQGDLVVYDPGTHERGLPDIEFFEDEDGQQVETSRTLHVHRFYYNGDKKYQFSLIQGGPTTVVANHPRTGEKVYLNVDLPSGAPVISYNKHSISYIFPDRRVIIDFGTCKYRLWGGECVPTIKTEMHQSHSPARYLRDTAASAKNRLRAATANNPLVVAMKDTAKSVGKTATGVVGVAATATGGAINRARETVEQLPVISQAQQAADQRVEQGQRFAIDRATKASEKAEQTSFMKTNR